MSKFKVLLIGGIAAGVLAGGTIALFTSGKKPATSSTPPSPAAVPAIATSPVASSSSNPVVAVPEKAEDFNKRGLDFMFSSKFREASQQFREALARVPDPKYFFNLGTSLFQEGKFDEALTALDGLQLNGPTDTQVEKSAKLRQTILDECKAQGVTCGSRGSDGIASARAASLNDEAKALMMDGDFEAASVLLRQAVRLHPEPKYWFNLATSLFQNNRFDDAIAALDMHRQSNPTPTEGAKAEKLLAKIYAECKVARIACSGMK